jgi:hypothetical protein
LPISGVRIAAQIVLAQLKGHKRIGEARIPLRHASPIVIKLVLISPYSGRLKFCARHFRRKFEALPDELES